MLIKFSETVLSYFVFIVLYAVLNLQTVYITNSIYFTQLTTGLGCALNWWSGGSEFAARVWPHSFVEIDHEIFSTVILSLPLVQEGKSSVTCERMCTEYWLTA